MSRNNNRNNPPNRVRKPAELRKIRQYYAKQGKKEKAGQTPAANNRPNDQSKQAAPQSAVGKVYRGETKYIDKEPKKQRNYVVVRASSRGVSVAKLKSIKKFDENGKNADKSLVEINHERYGLPKRTGVDYQTFNKNRMSGKPLDLKDKDVFPEDKERTTLSSHDKYRVLKHVGRNGNKNKK